MQRTSAVRKEGGGGGGWVAVCTWQGRRRFTNHRTWSDHNKRFQGKWGGRRSERQNTSRAHYLKWTAGLEMTAVSRVLVCHPWCQHMLITSQVQARGYICSGVQGYRGELDQKSVMGVKVTNQHRRNKASSHWKRAGASAPPAPHGWARYQHPCDPD